NTEFIESVSEASLGNQNWFFYGINGSKVYEYVYMSSVSTKMRLSFAAQKAALDVARTASILQRNASVTPCASTTGAAVQTLIQHAKLRPVDAVGITFIHLLSPVARGDVFDLAEDDMNTTVTPTAGISTTTATPIPTPSSTVSPDPEAAICSGRPFDAFLQLKNGSIYAFRDQYYFEMDERSVMPGYPKLIKDMWGISGPIDAAFTRINCQGKTYIFKGNKYWRFEDGVLDEDYPRDISVGFEKIPDDVDAAFAIPAPGHHGREKVYFFKGDRYYQYEFKHQPSHEECTKMTKSSPSVLFTSYTSLYCENEWDDLFTMLFSGLDGHHKGPRFISKDWVGIKPPIDAAMVGRLYTSTKPSPSPSPSPVPSRRRHSHRRKHKGKGSRHSRSLFWEDFGLDYEERYFGAEKRGKGHKKGRGRRPSLYDYSYELMDYTDVENVQEKTMPVQNVYFFKK
ncbi:hypothetical protein NFI96_019987, partial [Prochilodus magdalenae]